MPQKLRSNAMFTKAKLGDGSTIEWNQDVQAFVRQWPDKNRQKVLTFDEAKKLIASKWMKVQMDDGKLILVGKSAKHAKWWAYHKANGGNEMLSFNDGLKLIAKKARAFVWRYA